MLAWQRRSQGRLQAEAGLAEALPPEGLTMEVLTVESLLIEMLGAGVLQTEIRARYLNPLLTLLYGRSSDWGHSSVGQAG